MGKTITSLIDPTKKAEVLQRIKDRKSPLCVEEPMNGVKLPKAPEPSPRTVMEQGALNEKLLIAINRKNHDEVSRLIDAGANVNSRDMNDLGGMPINSGWTLLMYAVQSGDLKIVQLLLEKGATVIWSAWRGDSALELARKSGNQEIIDALLKAAEKSE